MTTKDIMIDAVMTGYGGSIVHLLLLVVLNTTYVEHKGLLLSLLIVSIILKSIGGALFVYGYKNFTVYNAVWIGGFTTLMWNLLVSFIPPVYYFKFSAVTVLSLLLDFCVGGFSMLISYWVLRSFDIIGRLDNAEEVSA